MSRKKRRHSSPVKKMFTNRFNNKKAICPKCLKLKTLTRHHCFQPKRFFGENEFIIYLCLSCHQEIEKILPLHRQLTYKEYKEIHRQWLRDEPVVVTDEEVDHVKSNNFQSIQDAFEHAKGMLGSVLTSSDVLNR